jgi:hypothetical protein
VSECEAQAQAVTIQIHPNQNVAAPVRPLPAPQAATFAPAHAPAPVAIPQIAPAPVVAADNSHQVKQARCRAIDEEIQRIDAITRQPLTEQQQDYWKARRKEWRDTQFRMHC